VYYYYRTGEGREMEITLGFEDTESMKEPQIHLTYTTKTRDIFVFEIRGKIVV
jgi:hypothetical protein